MLIHYIIHSTFDIDFLKNLINLILFYVFNLTVLYIFHMILIYVGVIYLIYAYILLNFILCI